MIDGPSCASASWKALTTWRVVAAEGDLRHVDGTVADGFHGEVFAAVRLAAGGKLRNGAARCGLGRLATGVGVDLGVENEDVDVLARAKDVIESAEADVERPSVAAQNPHALANQSVGNGEQVAGVGGVDRRQASS